MSGQPREALARSPLPIVARPSGSSWVRIHSATRPAEWFGPALGRPPLNRFDDPQGEYRVCYLGRSLEAAFAETFLRNPPVRILSLADLAARLATEFVLTRPVRLVEFHSVGLVRIGVTAEVAHGSYAECRRWSRVFWEHPDQPDGIEYRSRHDDEFFCVALFDRAAGAIAQSEAVSLAADRVHLGRLVARYGVAVNP